MDATLKVLKEYTVWKSSLKKVLDKNLNEIIDLIIDAGGYNTLIPLKSIAQSNLPPLTFPTALNPISPNNFQAPIEPAKQIHQGVLVSIAPNSAEKLAWFYDNQRFFLINHNSNIALNTNLPYSVQSGYIAPYSNVYFTSNTENQIEFLLAILNWLPELQKILVGRMKSFEPSDADSKITSFFAAIKNNKINSSGERTE